MDSDVRASTTRDSFFGGRLLLEQPVKGHRSGTDAVLLAAAVSRTFAGRLYDVGAGVGAVGLGVALACPAATVSLIENNETCVELAAANIAANGLEARVTVMRLDVLSRVARQAFMPRTADLVVTNPPFYSVDRVRASPEPRRRNAHVMAEGFDLEDWLLACLACLGPKGSLLVVHNAAAVPKMLDLLGTRLGDLTLMPIHPRADQPAVRVLLRGTKGSRAPFRITPPLVLHDADGFTPQVAALHAGTAGLEW